jgi:hypothetical protein
MHRFQCRDSCCMPCKHAGSCTSTTHHASTASMFLLAALFVPSSTLAHDVPYVVAWCVNMMQLPGAAASSMCRLHMSFFSKAPH